jgi:integrase
MAKRLQAFLHQNRLGTFTFRWRPPGDVAEHFAQRAFEYSLGTRVRSEAWHRALPVTLRAKALVTELRAMKLPKKPPLKTELVRSVFFLDGTRETVDYDPSKPAEVAEANRIFAEARQNNPAAPEALMPPESGVAPSPSPSRAAGGGPTISAAFTTFFSEKRATRAWKDPEHAERYDHGPIIKELIDVTGDRGIGALAVTHLRQYKEALMNSSSALATKKKKLQRLSAFLNWARDVHEITKVSTAILTLGKRTGAAKHYLPFDDGDLKALFDSEAYQVQSFSKASEFWIPLLGLYTGARINELAQLLVDDIADLDGVPVVRINEEGDKRAKTTASTRTLPLHPALIAAGLLTYKASIKAEGWDRLFPELTKSKTAKNGYGKDPGSHFTAYRRRMGVSPDVDRQKVFHSFRTTANCALRYLNVPLERRQRLVGHEAEDTNNAVYRPDDLERMFSITTLLEDMSKLSFPVSHPVYIAKSEHRLQRIAAARRRITRNKTGEPADLGASRMFTASPTTT